MQRNVQPPVLQSAQSPILSLKREEDIYGAVRKQLGTFRQPCLEGWRWLLGASGGDLRYPFFKKINLKMLHFYVVVLEQIHTT